jgi:hypothetical protein
LEFSPICEHCNKPISKYRIAGFDIDWLEAYLTDYFQQRDDFLYRRYNSYHPTNPKISISYYMLKKYGRVTQKFLSERYGRVESNVSEMIRTVDENSHDVIFLNKELSGELDLTIHQNGAPCQTG